MTLKMSNHKQAINSIQQLNNNIISAKEGNYRNASNSFEFKKRGRKKPNMAKKDLCDFCARNKLDSEEPCDVENPKHRHIKTVECYHTAVCEDNNLNKCPHDFFKCFHSHMTEYIRRKVYRLKSTNNWNYKPKICPVIEKGLSCSNGELCGNAHSNDEKMYHPDNFKKTFCSNFEGNIPCSRGKYCFKAHGIEDLSQLTRNDFPALRASFSPGGKGLKEATSGGRKSISAEFKNTTNTVDALKMTVHNATKDPNFYMFEYKTKPCLNAPCSNMRCCTNYHHDQERRRSPKDFKYSAEPCTFVKQAPSSNCVGKWREPSRCEKLVLCEFSHTLLEQMYHPHIYKTSLCSNYFDGNTENVKQNCLWGNLCTHAHGKSDLRSRSDQTKIFDYVQYSETFLKPKINGKLELEKAPKLPETPKKAKALAANKPAEPRTNFAFVANMTFSEALRSGCANIELQNRPPIVKNCRSLFNHKTTEETPSKKSTPKPTVSDCAKPKQPKKALPKPATIPPKSATKSNKNDKFECKPAKPAHPTEQTKSPTAGPRTQNGLEPPTFVQIAEFAELDELKKLKSPKSPNLSNSENSQNASNSINSPKTGKTSIPESPPQHRENGLRAASPLNVKKYFSPVIGSHRRDENGSAASPAGGEALYGRLPFGRQPLKIVQDSPMFELYGRQRRRCEDSLVIDYKELFENLRRRHLCPLCRAAKAARDRVFVPCGHFFCNECVSKLAAPETNGLSCPHCKKKCDSVQTLAFD